MESRDRDLALKKLKDRILQLRVLSQAALNQSWYQQTIMPQNAISGVSLFQSTFQTLKHEHLKSQEFKHVLSYFIDLKSEKIIDPTLSGDDKRMVFLAYRDWKREQNIPPAFTEAFSKVQSKLFDDWKEARKTRNFEPYQDTLLTLFRMLKQKACWISPNKHPYDVLLEEYEPGMSIAKLDPLFQDLKQKIFSLLHQIQNSPKKTATLSLNEASFDRNTQMQMLADHVVKPLGFDFTRGMLDKSLHPFCIGAHPDDVKIALNPRSYNPFKGVTSALHETGHGLYEQNLQKGEVFGMPQSKFSSYGMHEGIARFYQTCIGLSLPFWEYMLPKMQAYFPESLKNTTPSQVYEHLNAIQISPIRNSADELTYTLHILIRYEVEKEILGMENHELRISHIRNLWNAKYKEYLGIDMEGKTDLAGFMQDVHWCNGCVGYFPSYLIGNLIASQLHEKLKSEHKDFDLRIQNGDFTFLLPFLNQSIFSKGALKTTNALVLETTGKPLSTEPFISRIAEKFCTLYDLTAQDISEKKRPGKVLPLSRTHI
jgi:carboxypeptidase Taq